MSGASARLLDPEEALRDPGLRAELDRLAQGDPTRTLAWFALWRRAFAPKAPAILALAEDAGAGPFAALAVVGRRLGGRLGAQALAGGVNGHSQRSLALAAPGREREAAGRWLAALERAGGWDLLRLQGLADPSIATPLAEAARAAGLFPRERHAFVHALRRAGTPWPEAEAAITAGTRRSRARLWRQLERAGGPAPVRLHRGRRDGARALAAYAEAERRSWKGGPGGETIFATPAQRRFYEGLAEVFDHAFEVRLVEQAGRVLAGLVSVRGPDDGPDARLATLKTFYAAEAAKHSPGWQLLREAARAAHESEGIAAVDFQAPPRLALGWSTPGAEAAFLDLDLWASGPRARILRAAHAARRRVASSARPIARLVLE
ncbi:MAG: GNAT family N-acetyltransferase [Pseudomonadota bacterium]